MRCSRSGGHPSEQVVASILYDLDGAEIGRHSSPYAAGDQAAGQDCMIQIGQWLYRLPGDGPHQLIGSVN